MIRNIQKAIDYAIFAATPATGDYTSKHQTKLSTYLQLCQDQINGMATPPAKIDPDSDVKLKELKRKVEAKITALEREKKQVSESEQQELGRRIKELKDAQKELDKIIASTTKYAFKIDKYPEFRFDKKSNTGTIKYDGSIGSLLNELKHAFQFETGKIDFIETQDANGQQQLGAGLLYDIHDEIETYKRQYAYDGMVKFQIELSSEDLMNALKSGKLNLKDIGSTGSVTIKKMNQITVDVIVKVSDGVAKKSLYSTISRKSLDKNSRIKDVIKGNKNRKNTLEHFGLKNFDKKKPYIDFVKVYISKKTYIHVK